MACYRFKRTCRTHDWENGLRYGATLFNDGFESDLQHSSNRADEPTILKPDKWV